MNSIAFPNSFQNTYVEEDLKLRSSESDKTAVVEASAPAAPSTGSKVKRTIDSVISPPQNALQQYIFNLNLSVGEIAALLEKNKNLISTTIQGQSVNAIIFYIMNQPAHLITVEEKAFAKIIEYTNCLIEKNPNVISTIEKMDQVLFLMRCAKDQGKKAEDIEKRLVQLEKCIANMTLHGERNDYAKMIQDIRNDWGLLSKETQKGYDSLIHAIRAEERW